MQYYVVAPDSSGSKGDEAMMRGVLNILRDQKIVILTTSNPAYSWQSELLDRCEEFEEIIVPFEDIAEGVLSKGILIIVGADILDGTCGVAPALSRLRAMKKMEQLGGEVYAFGSFRSDVKAEILNMIKKMGEAVHWLLREETSCLNLLHSTGIRAEFFPDFAYYCETANTGYVEAIKAQLHCLREEGRKIIGVNFSQPSCNSFFEIRNDISRKNYVKETLETIRSEEELPFFVLISHDTRTYKNHWSDQQFQELAASVSDERDVLCLRGDISYPELLCVLPELDYVVSGRMHLAVAALRSGCIPIIYTGAGENHRFTMAEKCKGMMKNRIGEEQLVATNKAELVAALRLVERERENLKSKLENQNIINQKRESDLNKKLQRMLRLQRKDSQLQKEQNGQALIALRTMSRNIFSFEEEKFVSQEVRNVSLEKQMVQIEAELSDVQCELKSTQEKNRMQEIMLEKQQRQIANLYNQIHCLKDLVDLCEQRIVRIKQIMCIDNE